MYATTKRRLAARAVVLLLSLMLLAPVGGLAAQEEPQPPPGPAPDRSPVYDRQAPPGALRLPGDPPGVGELVAEDRLNFPGAIPDSVRCVTGRNIGEFVGEGYILKVTGR